MTRIERGFRRLGVFLAVPFLAGALLFGGYYKFFQPNPPAFEFKSSAEMSRPEKDPFALWAAASLAGAGGLIWIACAGLGWALAGFARD